MSDPAAQTSVAPAQETAAAALRLGPDDTARRHGHDHAHRHEHGHEHGRSHRHEHGHAHDPGLIRAPGFSLLLLSVRARLAGAAALSALVWAGVLWALA